MVIKNSYKGFEISIVDTGELYFEYWLYSFRQKIELCVEI